MASIRRPRERDPGTTPIQDDEEDVVRQVRAEEDENGNLVTTPANIKRVGAYDAESVRENRQRREIVKRKRAKEKGVSFNSDDVLTIYDDLLKTSPAGGAEIRMKRLTGSQVTYTIKSQPRSGTELYDVFMQHHVQGGGAEAEYKITFVATHGKQYLGGGRITLPDTRPLHLREQPMGYYPPQQPPPYAPPGYPPAQQQPQQAPQPTPASSAPQDRFAEFNAMRDFMMSLGWNPPGQPAPQPQQPALPPGMSMAQMQEMAGFFKSMGWNPPQQPTPQATPQYVPPQPQQQPSAMQPPAVTPPPGHELVFRPDTGWTIQPIPRQMFRRNEDGHESFQQQPYRVPPQGPPQQRDQTPVDSWRRSLTDMRQMKNFASEVQSVFGGGSREQYEPPEQGQEDEGPLKTQKFGDLDTIVDENTGGIAWGPTIAVNFPKGVKWLGEQIDKVKQEQQRAQQQPEAPQQPYPGQQVRVNPGDKPPEGWKFVVEEQPQQQAASAGWPQQQQPLPPPPAQVPPTIQEVQPPPPGQIAWNFPPEGGR